MCCGAAAHLLHTAAVLMTPPAACPSFPTADDKNVKIKTSNRDNTNTARNGISQHTGENEAKDQ